LGHDKADDAERASDSKVSPSSDIWVAVPSRTYDHMAKVARDARDLLGSLHADIEGLRLGFNGDSSPEHLTQSLHDIEASCERINNMLEDALVGARRDGLNIQRSSLSLASVMAAALKQVRATAEARRVSFVVAMLPDVAARLDRTLLTRALVKLMGRIVAEVDAGSEIGVEYRLERGDVTISFVRNSESTRPGGPGPSNPKATPELDFCHLVAECHGGALTTGRAGPEIGTLLYRIDLPWVA